MPSNVGKGPSADQNAVPQRVPRQHTSASPASSAGAAPASTTAPAAPASTGLEQQVTQLSQTVDALLQFVNNTFAPVTTSRTPGGTGGVTTTSSNSGDVNLRGSINPDLKVTRNIAAGSNITAGNNLTAGKVVSGTQGVIDNRAATKGSALVSYNGAPLSDGGAAFTAVPTGGGLGLRVTNQANTGNSLTIDSTGKLASKGPYDVTGNSVVRGNLQVTGTVGPNPSPVAPMMFGAGADDTPTQYADPDGELTLGSLTVDGPTQINNNLDVTAPATFSDITSSGMVNAEMLAVNGTQIATDQQVTNDSTINGDLHVGGGAYFGAGGGGNDPTAQAYASVIDGTISGVTVTASGAVTGANLVTSGDVSAATAHISNGAITTISGNSATYTTGTFTNLTAGSISSNGTPVITNGNVTATDVSTVTLEASGASTLKAVSVTSLTASGALTGATLSVSGNASTGPLTAASITSNGAVSGTTITASGAINGAALTISGNSSLGGTTTAGTLNAGATTLNSLTVTNAANVGSLSTTGAITGATLNISGTSTFMNLAASGTLNVTGASTLTGGATINNGATVNGALMANNGVVTNDVLTTTIETTGAASVGTALSVGTTGTFLGSVTTPNIIAAAGYLTSVTQAQYWDTAYTANTNKLMNAPVIWNVSGNNGLLGTGIGGSAYAAVLDWAYVPPVNGSLESLTGYVYTTTAATVTLSLYVNGTSAFSGNVVTTAATRKYFALVSTRGALPFSAGSYLQLYIKATTAQTNFYCTLSPHVYL